MLATLSRRVTLNTMKMKSKKKEMGLKAISLEMKMIVSKTVMLKVRMYHLTQRRMKGKHGRKWIERQRKATVDIRSLQGGKAEMKAQRGS